MNPGSAGGYLVPTEYGNTLIQVAAMQNKGLQSRAACACCP